MKKSNVFIKYLREFFTVYLPKQKNCSPHTILACQQTWNMLLSYICLTGKKLENITFTDLNRTAVAAFLDEMENSRGWTPTTRNHRLSRIRSFFKFVADFEPTLIIYLEALKGIPQKKIIDKSRVMEFMLPDAMSIVLRQPDITQKMGIRDMFFMVLMYDSAARDCEMLSMRLCDINTESNTVYLMGKNSKLRCVPLSEDTIQHFHRYKKLFHPADEGTLPMFYTVRHHEKTAMSDDNVARFLQKYGTDARVICPEIPEKITPHMFRRSRAMNLYRSGMPLALLAEFLGHEDPETTLIYAYADTDMKRKAIEQAEVGASVRPITETGVWEGDEDMIKRLCGLI